MTDTSTLVPALYLRRAYAASPARVFDAWTTPELLSQFLVAPEIKTEVVLMEPRLGGRYRIAMHHEDERGTWFVGGEFREFVPAHRLIMTWRWEEDDPADEYDTLITIELTPNGSGTDLEFTHAQFATLESRNGHERGWGPMLDELATVLAK